MIYYFFILSIKNKKNKEAALKAASLFKYHL